MEIGIIFPQTELNAGRQDILQFSQRAEQLGFSHIFVADHVLGADPEVHEHVRGHNYTHKSIINEVFTTLGFMSAITDRIKLMTGILILPQRSTALVAKQAAEVAILSNSRLRLGIGVGWNHVEFEALGMDFSKRGAVTTEQIQVLRKLWTSKSVNYHGDWHHITDAGINPLPQAPIPIWLGAGSSLREGIPKVVLERVAKYADGWCPSFGPGQEGQVMIDKVNNIMLNNSRDPASLLLEGRIRTAGKSDDSIKVELEKWRELGATHIGIENRGAGLQGVESHVDAMEHFVNKIGLE